MKDNKIHKIVVYKREEFRSWLKKNGMKESKVAVIVHKKHTGKPAPSHRELMEEAICFGWIDTTIKRLDHNKFVRYFSKRNKNSRWSDNTLRYGKDLIKRKLMTEEGLKFYKLGLKKPTHDHGIPKNPDMPEEMKKALDRDKKARKSFDLLSPSVKRAHYRWFLRAKLPETRRKRLKKIFELAIEKNGNLFKLKK